MPNCDLWARANQEPMAAQVSKRKWRWVGHTLRKQPDNITRQALEWNPQGKRKRGRPKQTWIRSVMDELKHIGMTWEGAKKTARDRRKWRITVEALCSTRSKED